MDIIINASLTLSTVEIESMFIIRAIFHKF